MGGSDPGRSAAVKAIAEVAFFIEPGAKAVAEPRKRAAMAAANCMMMD
jgi:hypothetical protein